VVATSACSWRAALQKLGPSEDEFARRYIDLIRADDRAQARALLDPRVRDTATDQGFAQLRELLDRGTPREIEVIGANLIRNLATGETRAQLGYQIHDPAGYVAAAVLVRHSGCELVVEGFHAEPLAGDLRVINAFTFGGKGPVHFLMLLALTAEVALIVFALVRCAMTPLRRRKWLWILFVLLGFGNVMFNWTTGQFDFRLIAVQVLGIAASKSGPYAPWILAFSIPVGAIVFLAKRRALIAEAAKPPVAAADAGARPT
jgi:hypothetical protein